MATAPSSLVNQLRPAASLLPEALRSRLAFALAYSSELALPVPAVFLRELSVEGRGANRSALARSIVARVERVGLRLDERTDPGAVREVLLDREYEWPGFVPGSDWTVLDVGAQHGEYAVLCAVVYGADVLAFEPLASNCEVIDANVRLNRTTRVRVFPLALGATDGELVAHRYDTMLVRAPGRFPDRSLRVRQARLDGLDLEPIASTRRIILKVDVEGFEREVFDGAAGFIERFQPQIVVETDAVRRDAVEAFLRGAGYRVVHRKAKPTGEILFARAHGDVEPGDRVDPP